MYYQQPQGHATAPPQNFKAAFAIGALRLIGFIYFRATIVGRIALIFLLEYFRQYNFIHLLQWLLIGECVLYCAVTLLRTFDVFVYHAQSILHRLLPSVYAPPMPLGTHNHNHNLTTALVVEKLLPTPDTIGGESLLQSAIEIPYEEVKQSQITMTKDGRFDLDGEQILTKQQIKNRLSAAKAKHNPNKPSPAILTNIEKWQNILGVVERLEAEQRKQIDKEFEQSINPDKK